MHTAGFGDSAAGEVPAGIGYWASVARELGDALGIAKRERPIPLHPRR